jgi:DNA-binding transcriptional regulator WhiA
MSKYKYISDYFNTVDSQEKAYWIGFLYADGCIRNNGPTTKVLEVTLAECDTKHLEKLKDVIVPNGILYSKTRRLNGKIFNHKKLVVTNRSITKALMALGCTPRKSLTMVFPDNKFPMKYMRHFVRGYFDGDGALWISKNGYSSLTLSISCGSRQFLEKLRKWFMDEIGVSYNKIYQKSATCNCYDFKKQGVDAVKIMRYLYNDSSVYLERKYCIFIKHRRLVKITRKNHGKKLEPLK